MTDYQNNFAEGRRRFKDLKEFAEQWNLPIEKLMEDTLIENNGNEEENGDGGNGEEFVDGAGMLSQFEADEEQHRQDFGAIGNVETALSFNSNDTAHSEQFRNLAAERNTTLNIPMLLGIPPLPRTDRVSLVNMAELLVNRFPLSTVNAFCLFMQAIKNNEDRKLLIDAFDLRDLKFTNLHHYLQNILQLIATIQVRWEFTIGGNKRNGLPTNKLDLDALSHFIFELVYDDKPTASIITYDQIFKKLKEIWSFNKRELTQSQ